MRLLLQNDTEPLIGVRLSCQVVEMKRPDRMDSCSLVAPRGFIGVPIRLVSQRPGHDAQSYHVSNLWISSVVKNINIELQITEATLRSEFNTLVCRG